jgi:uncharacterized protein (DUF305 family)
MQQTHSAGLSVALLIAGLAVGYALGYTMTPEQELPLAGMHGAVESMTAGLEGKIGDALDRAFLNEMIVHHEGALEMAQALLAGTQRAELKELGANIISAQTREIEQMKSWRTDWFNH